MPISQHSHSGQFCRHGHGKLEQVVQEAIRQGFISYALTEHVPRFAQEHLYPEESDMTVADLRAQFDAFLVEARRLQRVYADQIDLVVGCETEYITKVDLAELDALTASTMPPLLVVGSVHHVGGTPIDFSRDMYANALTQHGGSHVNLYAAYFDAQLDLITRVRPHVIGHFDLIGIFAPSPDVHLATLHHATMWPRVERNIRAAVAAGSLFEINARAWKKGIPGYPHIEVAKTIASLGGRFTLSDDAHGPKDVGLNYRQHVPTYLAEVGVEELFYWTGKLEAKSIRVANDPVWTRFFAASP
ncbi:histidinol phosphate phosphatase HisJ family protein [Allomyces macrogynus ATCC 38327]|uniref:Histidinol-phosphatase n=1 Tax=Allomyces macrogynus (strain ATCC 38327) TaxID=578462 RepID=A0A0L0S4Z5_ALLM3|nr:histidinol phosphate phosphatase HisJ family protein [Allomyces macrogynus ATCC 38327]|eukprot:KNE57471.1 histidinol phosphate phosphatase HisJ family protein [Allomyces macrogynus ATCC 38327]